MALHSGDGQLITKDNPLPVHTPRPKLVKQDFSQNIEVAPGGNANVIITPPKGEIWRMRALTIIARYTSVTGATTGSHYVHMGYWKDNARTTLITGRSNMNAAVEFSSMQWASADAQKSPSDGSALAQVVMTSPFTEEFPMVINYWNQFTGGTYKGKLEIVMIREVEYEY